LKTRILAITTVLAVGFSGTCFAGSYSNDFSSGVGAASLRGSAVVDSGSVRLTPNAGGNEGSLVIDNLDPGRTVQSFDASFMLAIGPGSTPPADGVSFSFGPPPGGTYGESGAPTGIAVVFDIYDNGETPTPPVIRIMVNGTQVAATTGTLFTAGAFVPVSIHVDGGGLDLNFNSGAIVFTNALLPGYVPSSQYQFTFGARTGSLAAEQRIDDVAITTSVAAPLAVPTLAEWGTIALAGLLALFAAFALRGARTGRIGTSRRV